jgi:pyridoxine 4-dehydrogenase
MAMSGSYGQSNDDESVETIVAALDRGVTFLDTGDFYGAGHNESLIREALWDAGRDNAFISVKFGVQWSPDRRFLGIDTRPASVKNYLTYTLRRLGTDYVDLYQPARLDPAVPIEETVGAIAELVEAGYVRHIGLSEVSPLTLRRAHDVHPIAAVQAEYSLFSRGVEEEMLCTIRDLGIGLVAYGVLSRGLLSGRLHAGDAPPADGRARFPRFSGENLSHNLALVDALRGVAERRGATVAQLAIAWVLSRRKEIVPLIGARRPDQLDGALGALDIELSAEDLAEIETIVPAGAVAGDRYTREQMAALDSERELVH